MTEVATGTSFVCAMCEWYWEGKEIRTKSKRLIDILRDDQLCTSTSSCGSPLAGDAFHEYKGPITDFEGHCFVCGAPSEFGVKVRNLLRIVGVCKTHVEWFPRFVPQVKGEQVLPEWERRDIVQ